MRTLTVPILALMAVPCHLAASFISQVGISASVQACRLPLTLGCAAAQTVDATMPGTTGAAMAEHLESGVFSTILHADAIGNAGASSTYVGAGGFTSISMDPYNSTDPVRWDSFYSSLTGLASLSDTLYFYTGGGGGICNISYTYGIVGGYNFGGEVKIQDYDEIGYRNTIGGTRSASIPFTDGVPVLLNASVSVWSSSVTPLGGQWSSNEVHGHISLNQFSVTDAAGNPMQGFSYSSQSGYDYALLGGTFLADPAPAPEPATFGVGLLALCLILSHYRRSRFARLYGSIRLTLLGHCE